MKHYDDTQFINCETIDYYANTNEEFIKGEINGIVIEFPGLGGGSCLGGQMDRGVYDTYYTQDFAKNGILVAYLFPGPWSWGNKGAVRMADAVVTALKRKYRLCESIPLVACGGSMGGHGSLMFACKTSHKITAVAAACPGIDAVAYLDVHPDFPRTYVSAALVYDMSLMDALREMSPVCHIDDMPDVPYFICSDGKDEIFPEKDCENYVEALSKRGLSVCYHAQPNLAHGHFYPEVREALHSFIKDQILK